MLFQQGGVVRVLRLHLFEECPPSWERMHHEALGCSETLCRGLILVGVSMGHLKAQVMAYAQLHLDVWSSCNCIFCCSMMHFWRVSLGMWQGEVLSIAACTVTVMMSYHLLIASFRWRILLFLPGCRSCKTLSAGWSHWCRLLPPWSEHEHAVDKSLASSRAYAGSMGLAPVD
jgi:hypothetical protein